MELSNRQVITLFPSYLFVGKIPDLTLCDRLDAALRAMKAANEGVSDELSYMTRDDIWKRHEMKELVDLVLAESAKVLDFYKVKRDSHYVTNMWGNITRPNHQQALHVHPNCLLSGIIYVTGPKDAGTTMWGDPRPGVRMLEPSFSEMNVHNMGRFSVAPEKGVMVIWPSFLPHGVERGTSKSNEDRIIVAFNVMIRGLISTRTARLELK